MAGELAGWYPAVWESGAGDSNGGAALSELTGQLITLQNAFVQVLGIPPDSDFDSLAYGCTVGWDSVAHMALIAEIEVVFDIMLSTEEVIGLSNFGRAREALIKHGIQLEA
jgi:acyl carrier protein